MVGIFVCIILLEATVSAVGSTNKNYSYTAFPNANPEGALGNWTQIQKLLASDGESNDNFGCSVSLYGDTVLIGAYGYDNAQGSAYVFTRTGTTWTQQAKLLASDGAEGDWFGTSVALNGDTAFIGAYHDNDHGILSGSAYVFTRTGTTWSQQAKLLASDGAVGDYFGCSVSLYGDTALIGAYGYDNAQGSAYVFTRTGTTWTQQAKLLASNGTYNDEFGCSVALDNDTALIGALSVDDKGFNSGSAYVFNRTETTWTQQAKLLASDGKALDVFGCSVSLYGDTALIGAYGDDNTRGSAYVFTRTGTTWTQQAKLLASDGTQGKQFGSSVALDNDTALIGEPNDFDNGAYSGSAYLFNFTGDTWMQQAKFLARDGAAGDYFGCSVSLYGDTALIGAYGYDNTRGSAYVFIKESENLPPNPPTIDGPSSGKIGQPYTYTFNSIDPNGNNVYYFIDWGDNTTSDWIGQYASGIDVEVNHTWAKQETYILKAKAKDIYYLESGWATLTVTMPTGYQNSQQSQGSLFHRIFGWLFNH